MKSLKAALFFGLMAGTIAFCVLLIRTGSGFRLLALAAFPAGALAAAIAFLIPGGRFPVLVGMFSGALTSLATAVLTYAIGLFLLGDFSLRDSFFVAWLSVVPLLNGKSAWFVVAGVVLGGAFVRWQLLRAERLAG